MPTSTAASAPHRGRRPARAASLAVLALVMALTGCGGAPAAPAPAPSALTRANLVGAWCGDPGEKVSLAPDGTFVVEGLSVEFTDQLLADDGYVDGYRLRTEFGGVRPTTGAGTWQVQESPTFRYAMLGFDRLDRRAFDYGFSLSVDDDEGERLLYFSIGDPDSGDRHTFRRCESG